MKFLYKAGIRRRYRPPVKTVCVGNITVGGTGKSPMVELLASELSGDGKKVVVVRRDRVRGLFGADLSDEARVFSANVPAVEQVMGSNKVRAVREACSSPLDIVIVDDGFQTMGLERDLDIVMIDAAAPFGNGRLLPSGTLREPPSALRRAGAIVLARCEDVREGDVGDLRRRIGELTDAPIFEARYEVSELTALGDEESQPPSFLAGRKVFAFCGIGNPDGFVSTLRRLDCEVAGSRFYRDHHVYSAEDVLTIENEAGSCGAEMVVTTQKDAVRLAKKTSFGRPAYYVEIRLDISEKSDLIKLISDSYSFC